MYAQRVASPLIDVKLIAGACLRRYTPGPSRPSSAVSPLKQPVGTFSAYSRQVRPDASIWSATLAASTSWASLSWMPCVDPLKSAR
jgi:hypothetical protein